MIKNFNENLNYFNIQLFIIKIIKKYKIKQVIKSNNYLFTDYSRFHTQNISKSMQKMLQKLEASVTKNSLIKTSFKHTSKKN